MLVTDSGISGWKSGKTAHTISKTQPRAFAIASLSRKCTYIHVHTCILIRRMRIDVLVGASARYCKTFPPHPPPSCRTAVLFCVRTFQRSRIHRSRTNTSPSFHPLRSSNPSVSDALLSTLVRSHIPPHSVRSLNSPSGNWCGRSRSTKNQTFFLSKRKLENTWKIQRSLVCFEYRDICERASSMLAFSRMTS